SEPISPRVEILKQQEAREGWEEEWSPMGPLESTLLTSPTQPYCPWRMDSVSGLRHFFPKEHVTAGEVQLISPSAGAGPRQKDARWGWGQHPKLNLTSPSSCACHLISKSSFFEIFVPNYGVS